MKKNKYFILLSLLLIYSCSSKSTSKKEIGLLLLNRPLEMSSKFEAGKEELFNRDGILGTVFKLDFTSENEAKHYAMERRLLLLRKFETLVEPYFGTALAKECGDNILSNYLKNIPGNLQLLLQIPVKGSARLIHDCLKENNTEWANIEFIVCGKTFYDVRTYTSITLKRPKYEPRITCQ